MFYYLGSVVTSYHYWKSVIKYEFFFKKLYINISKLILICGFLLSFLKTVFYIYFINKVYKNFKQNIPVGLNHIRKFKKFFLNGRLIYEYISIFTSIFSGLFFFFFIDYFRYFIVRLMLEYAHFFLCLIEYKAKLQLFWHDVVSRVRDMRIGFLHKDNFFYKLNFPRISYYMLFPTLKFIKNVVLFSFWGFSFLTKEFILKNFKTFFFFFQIL